MKLLKENRWKKGKRTIKWGNQEQKAENKNMAIRREKEERKGLKNNSKELSCSLSKAK